MVRHAGGFVNPPTESLTALLKAAARELGFELVGVAPAVTPAGFSRLQAWIEQGFAGEMQYIPRREAAYEHPRHVLGSVKSLLVVAMNYRTAEAPALDANQGRVSRYAWGTVDYHDLLRDRLRQLADRLHALSPGCHTRAVVDTAPLLERDFARLAGLGWFGKNTLLINKHQGSFLFLGALLTDAALELDEPHETAHCGTCTRCLEICPTQAFPEPYVLDAQKCISYLTIELKSQIPVDLRSGVGAWLFGCDLCQDVCPWNRKAPQTTRVELTPQADLHPASALDILQSTEAEFQERFGQTPLARPGWIGLRRNAAIVLGNQGDHRAIPALSRALNDPVPMIRGASAWALGQLGGDSAHRALQSRLAVEDNADVQHELHAALSFES
jgi:epoxyqueuosine reductase